MAIVAQGVSVVVGVDTHAKSHVLVAVDAATGAAVGQARFPTSAAGLNRATAWVQRRAGSCPLVAMEGTNSYGATFTRRLHAAGIPVSEVAVSTGPVARGKDDFVDAENAARWVLAGHPLASPRSIAGDVIEAVDVLLTAHHQLTRQRTATINRLTALLRRHDLGIDVRAALTGRDITTVARWRTRRTDPLPLACIRSEATRLARTITDLTTQLHRNQTHRDELLQHCPTRLHDQPGIGPIVEAEILTSWSHRHRIHSEAAFAQLAGTAPLPASSGNTTRHRLNRYGDRRLNNAIWRIAFWRFHHDPHTQPYITRRRTQGHSDRDIIRSLKRYIARNIWRQLHQQTIDTTP